MCLEFLARILTHIPDKGHVTTRYCGWYANRSRRMRRLAALTTADAPVSMVVAPKLAPTEAMRRWAALIRQYLPKRASMVDVSQYDCNRIATNLNRRPRKRLGYRTPEECYVP